MRSVMRDELECARDELEHLVLRVLLQMTRECAHMRGRQVGHARRLTVHPCAVHTVNKGRERQQRHSGDAQLTA